METREEQDQQVHDWQRDIFAVFRDAGVGHVGYVPDGGHKGLIRLCEDDTDTATTVLTTEEEGIGLAAGLALGGIRTALLMQSSGVGNCVNMFSLAESCRFPLLLLVTMRGEWAEFIPWQVPMGSRTEAVLKTMGFDVFRARRADEVRGQTAAALDQAYFSNRMAALLLSQELIGRKNWSK